MKIRIGRYDPISSKSASPEPSWKTEKSSQIFKSFLKDFFSKKSSHVALVQRCRQKIRAKIGFCL